MLIENHDFEVPRTLVDIQARNLLNNFAQDIQRQGATLDALGKDFVQMAYERMSGQAARDVRGAMLLEKVAELEKVEVSGDEIAEEIDRMAQYYGVQPADVRKSLTQQGGENSIADRLRSRKAVEVLVDKAKIAEGKWEEPADEKPAKAEKEEKPKKAKKSK
jgi:trigger factor